MRNWNIGLDIGGCGVRIASKSGGVIYNESALTAYRTGAKKALSIGNGAHLLRGRETGGIRTSNVLESGRLTHEALLEMCMTEWIRIAQTENLRPNVLLIGGANAREADLQAVRAACLKAGAAEMSVLDIELAAALGAWFPQNGTYTQVDIMDPQAELLLDVGAYGMTAAVLAGGRIVRRETMTYGLSGAVDDLRRLLRTKFGIAIGVNSAEELFAALAGGGHENDTARVSGLSIGEELPCEMNIPAGAVYEAVQPYADAAAKLVSSVLAVCAEESLLEIARRGVVLTGGGGRIAAIAGTVRDMCGVPVRVSAEPELAAIRGTLRVMNAPNRFGGLVLNADE